MESEIKFVDKQLKVSFEELRKGKFEEKELYNWIIRAFKDLESNAFCGIQTPKKLIPKEYLKYEITNLWKYDLPKGWRLLYSIGRENIKIISLILEWLDHKNYERRFGYQ